MLTHMNVFSQTSYDVFFLGEYEDSIGLDQSLHWYISSIDQKNPDCIKRQFVPIDIKKDIVYVADTDRYHVSIDTSLHLMGYILIGSKDSLSTKAKRESDYSYNLRIGDNIGLYPQGFRDSSPFVNLMVSGTIENDCYTQFASDYKLSVGCFFTVYAYHKRYAEENYKSFKQDLNKLVQPVIGKKPIRHAYLILKAYIDNDEYCDLILNVGGTNVLLLSENYDFRHGKLYHIEKSWIDPRIVEF